MNSSLVPSARTAEFTQHLREFGEGLLRGEALFRERFLQEGGGSLTRAQLVWLMVLHAAGTGFIAAAAENGWFPTSLALG